MATERTFNTRILNKIDTLENWQSSTLKLKKGEIAIATVAATAGNGLEEPVIMIKIANEDGKTFSELPWSFYAKAADVIAEAKDATALETFVNKVIGDAGIATDEAMQALAGRVTTAEGKITTLEGEMDAVEAKAAANETAIGVLNGTGAGSVAKAIADALVVYSTTEQMNAAITTAKEAAIKHADDLDKAMDERVDVLEAAIAADGAVDTKIKNAIDALDVTDTAVAGKYVSAVNEVDGKVVITRADLPDYTETYDAKGAAAQALIDAKAYADAEDAKVEERVQALETAIGEGGSVETQIDAAIEELKLGETYAPISHTHEMGEVNGLGDAIAAAKKAGEDAAAAVDGKLTEHANAAAAAYETKTDAAAKLTEAKGYTDTEVAKVQGEVDALETYVGTIPEAATATDIVGYINEKTAGIASEGAMNELSNRVKAIEDDYLVEADKTELAGLVTTEKERAEGIEAGLQAAIDAINNADNGILAQAKAYADGKDDAIEAAQKAGDDAQDAVDALAEKVGEVTEGKTVVEMIADAQAAATYDDTQVKADIKANGDAIKAIQDDYLTSVEEKALQDQITANANAIELLTNGVSAEEVDGVNDLIQYVKDHGTEVTGMKKDISDNTAAIAAEVKRAGEAEAALAGRLDDLEAIEIADKDYVDQAEADAKTYADGLNTAMNTRVEALEAIDHDHANKAELDLIASGDKAKWDAAEAKAHVHANAAELDKIADGDVAKWNAAEQNAKDYADGLNTAMDERVDALEADTHTHANKTVLDGISAEKVTAWDAAVQTVTPGTGLKATKTGTDVAIDFDDEIVFVFDCGDATE